MKFAALALLGTASAQYNLLYSNDYDWVGDCYETLSASVCNQDYNVQTELDGGIASWDYTYEVTLTVHNHATNSLSLWWVDYDGYQQWYADIGSGESYYQGTFNTPPWVFYSCNNDGYCADQAIAICDTSDDVTAFVRDEANGDIQVLILDPNTLWFKS